ncbi:hypothetical protein CFOL_v3_16939 [Cephalotus follicularis]|uniref:Uncharacterized protein n=1 Tax=Cephalotus follicularis TaxID=3775 RepID=A0A1Q3C0A4_CEPFO|nr:hypothetical protein CFOL_v3_16939 [Cephalotus follicularis]
MSDMDGPLDFEMEDPLLISPAINNKQRKKKVIELDDLLKDYYNDKVKHIEKGTKKPRKSYDSDDDMDEKEAKFSQCVNECQNQMDEIGGGEEITEWGIKIFGKQGNPPSLVFPELVSCDLLCSFMNTELNSLVELTTQNGAAFLEGFLVNGWLSKLVFIRGHVEKSIANWTFNLMLYSSKEKLVASACDFWCAILSSEKGVNQLPITIDWFPSYSELKTALEIYGFLFNFLDNVESANTFSECRGPPQNIRAWIKCIMACCQVRNIFSSSNAEEIVEVLIYLLLDRQLQGLLELLHDCLELVVSYFTDEQWSISCEKIGKSLACRVPKDLNCLRAVECISGLSTRSKLLRSAVAHQILLVCFDCKATGEEEIMSLLISINIKDRGTVLVKSQARI